MKMISSSLKNNELDSNELDILKEFNNEYIVKYFDYFEPDPLHACIVIEYLKVCI